MRKSDPVDNSKENENNGEYKKSVYRGSDADE